MRLKAGSILGRIHRIHRRAGKAAFRRIPFVFAWAIGLSGAFAAFEEPAGDARTTAMGSVMLVSNGAGSVLSYPSGMAGPRPVSAFFSSAVPFGLRELAVFSCGAAVSSKLGNLGAAVSTSGRSLYRESTFAAAWSPGLGERLHAGVALRVLNLRIDGFGSWTGAALDAAVKIQLAYGWTFGFSGTNLNQTSIEIHSPIPQATRIGVTHVPVKNVVFAAEIEKDFRHPAGLRWGVEWARSPGFALRSGFSRKPSLFTCGFGVCGSGFGLDYACSVHPALGATHQATIRFYASPPK
jgi:hypothetical protein